MTGAQIFFFVCIPVYFLGFFISLLIWDFDDSPIPLFWPLALALAIGISPFVAFMWLARRVSKLRINSKQKWESR